MFKVPVPCGTKKVRRFDRGKRSLTSGIIIVQTGPGCCLSEVIRGQNPAGYGYFVVPGNGGDTIECEPAYMLEMGRFALYDTANGNNGIHPHPGQAFRGQWDLQRAWHFKNHDLLCRHSANRKRPQRAIQKIFRDLPVPTADYDAHAKLVAVKISFYAIDRF
jgi:hypothetical protein